MTKLNSIIKSDALQALKKIPSNSIDIGVTSPPYNKGEKQKGWLVKNVEYDSSSDKKDEQIYQNEQIEVLNELYRVIKPGGCFFYNHKLRWERGLMLHPMQWLSKTEWNIRQELIWDRAIAGNIRGWRFWQVEERIYWLCKSIENNLIGEELNSKHALMTSVWRFSPEQKSEHPAPFPLQLPLRCIYSVLDDKKNCSVIDPYCGSGTTLLAAKMLGHNYIGIDISQNYIDMANERLQNVNTEFDVFNEEMNRHIVRETFTERKNRGVYNHHNVKKRKMLKEGILKKELNLFSISQVSQIF